MYILAESRIRASGQDAPPTEMDMLSGQDAPPTNGGLRHTECTYYFSGRWSTEHRRWGP